MENRNGSVSLEVHYVRFSHGFAHILSIFRLEKKAGFLYTYHLLPCCILKSLDKCFSYWNSYTSNLPSPPHSNRNDSNNDGDDQNNNDTDCHPDNQSSLNLFRLFWKCLKRTYTMKENKPGKNNIQIKTSVLHFVSWYLWYDVS